MRESTKRHKRFVLLLPIAFLLSVFGFLLHCKERRGK